MNEITTVDNLIEQLRNIIRFQGKVVYDTPIYEKFHKEVTEYIHSIHFDNTSEANLIQKNLIWKPSQYLSIKEAEVILTALENIRLKMLERINGSKEPFWEYIHPIIIEVSQQLYLDTHYAKAVQAAFVEINTRVKKIRIQIDGAELDGDTLMRQTFSVNKPVLYFEDNSTESGKNVQQGYMDIFAGVMKGIRNPNAHENIEIDKNGAVRKLMLASLLMYKIDDAVKFTCSQINSLK